MSGSVSPTSAYIDATGIHAPAYADVLAYFQAQYRAIYGSDAYLGNDSQDGQLLAVFALAISDANAAAFAVYNSYSPATAQGVGLSSVVKINGIARNLPTNSVVDLVIVGGAGTPIIGGRVTDTNDNVWILPAVVTIPPSGQITVTATAQLAGNISADPGTVNTISTPTRGWQSVTNPSSATIGDPVELDGELRQRQAASTMQPSQTALDGVVGAIESLSGVISVVPYENTTSIPDNNGVPGHSVAYVVDGGDATAIANTIALRKTIGSGLIGTTQIVVVDSNGVPSTISFYRPTYVPITVVIHITPLIGYSSAIGASIVNAVVDAINALSIGSSVVFTRLFGPASLSGSDAASFNIISILIARGQATPSAANVGIAFTERATASTATVSVVIG